MDHSQSLGLFKDHFPNFWGALSVIPKVLGLFKDHSRNLGLFKDQFLKF